MSEILVVGSLGYDTISTPAGRRENILGGSANYFSLASSLYSKVNLVGVVGDDYKDSDKQILEKRGVNLQGLQTESGKTFAWEGKYEGDLSEAISLKTDLNVFENFNPTLPEDFKNSDYIFLANIDPVLQMRVLDQVDSPKLIGADTMNFWISSKKDDLVAVLKKVDVLLINEGEALQLSGATNSIAAIEAIGKMGPKAVVVKRGEYGFVFYSEGDMFIQPAFPVADVVDPTGAGDTFAGGFFGHLAKTGGDWSLKNLKDACVQGCLLASFTVQDFGVAHLTDLSMDDIQSRHAKFSKMVGWTH